MKNGPIIVNPQALENLGRDKTLDNKNEKPQTIKVQINPDLKVYTYDEMWEAIFDWERKFNFKAQKNQGQKILGFKILFCRI